MKREDIMELRQIAFKRFYSRPSYILRRLMRMRNLNDLMASIKGIKSLFWLFVRNNLFQRDGGAG